MKIRLLLLSLLSLYSFVYGQEYSKKELNYRPVNLDEAVTQLKKIHPDSTKQKIRSMTEEEFMSGTHFGLGMWIRNEWGLWKGKELADYFNSIGVFHPDDMSGIILTSYYRELKGIDWDVSTQVKFYQDYWKKSNEHFSRLKTDTGYQKRIEAQRDSIIAAQFEAKKQLWTSGKRISGYLDQCGLLGDFLLRTEIQGTIVEWRGNELLMHVDRYVDEKKKKKIVKCYNIVDDLITIKDHYLFRLVD